MLIYILLISIYAIFSVSFLLLLFDALRRIRNKAYYHKKDRLKEKYIEILNNFVRNKNWELVEDLFRKLPIGRIEREAFLEALLKTQGLEKEEIHYLAERTGLKNYYLNKLKSKRSLDRGEAYKILAYLGTPENYQIVYEAVKEEKDPELIFVGLLCLSKLIRVEDLKPFITLLESLFNSGYINMRTITICLTEVLLKFSDSSLDVIIDVVLDKHKNDNFVSAILDSLYFSPLKSPKFLYLADFLLETKENPEILSRAIKLLSKIPEYLNLLNSEKIFNLLKHNEWIVRLHTIRVCKYIASLEVLEKLTPLLSDENYFVRKETARIVVDLLIDTAPHKLSELLKMSDRFAIESLFEVMVREYSLKKDPKYLSFLRETFACFYSPSTTTDINLTKVDYGTS